MLFAALLIVAQESSVAPAAQVTPDPKAKPVWSIKADPCATARGGLNEIVVCGSAQDSPRLPLPAERGPPDHPVPSNPNVTGEGALAVATAGAPCAARVGGCQVGLDIFGAATFLVRAVGKAVDPNSCCDRPGEATNPGMLVVDAVKGVGRAFKKKDKRPRIAIPLDDSPMPKLATLEPVAQPVSPP